MKFDGVRQKVFLDRYALKGAEGELLENTPEEMWHRVAHGIAQQEKKSKQAKWEKEFYRVLEGFKFVPGGRILSGAGTGYQVTYFNCFVIPNPKDSRHGILESLGQLIEIQSRSGGVGLNLSSLRPRGARVKKVNGTSSGPVNWATLFSVATHDIVQQGGSRRGATMLMLHDWHPDVEEFITVKQDLTKINGANLSVCVSDTFMEAVKQDKPWDLVYPDLSDPHYDTEWDGDIIEWKEKGRKIKVYKTIQAKELWDLICTAAWRSAEPGLHFLERSNKRSNTWYFEKLLATNPCGEQPLGGWAVCNLGAMNLAAYVKDDDLKNDKGGWFDYEAFGKDVRVAMRFLDNVIDDTYYFFKENEQVAKDIRRTGLGIMGIADTFIKMKIRYGSEDSEKVSKKIFKTLRDNAYIASSDIAKEKGSFSKFDKEKYLKGYHIKALPQTIREKIVEQGIRNAVLLTIAPTGTTSLLAGVSSGVEPVYEFEYSHNGRLGKQMVYHGLYGEWKESHSDEERPAYFVGANDLTPEDHVKIQAIAQEYIDSSISKTVNAPNSHTVEDVKNLYMAAYDNELKGVTYFRDGSRMGVLQREEKKEEKKEEVLTLVEKPVIPITPRVARPMVLNGVTYKADSPTGKLYVTINNDEKGDMFEVFINHGKSGSDLMALADALGRMVSFVLRIHSPVPARERVREIVSELAGIGGSRSSGFGENRVRSLPDAISKVLARHCEFRVNGKVEDSAQFMQRMNGHSTSNGHATISSPVDMSEESPAANQLALPETGVASSPSTSLFDICPECGSGSFAYEEGCKKCYSCGYSEC
ncbi:MAG TPA: adenosylcobalamin-dependent ribonucleoside-diphosphate reductase [Candidatus Sulfotelmatobacter sp.]|jgi:ribonucleoside-diphosphate reductase alpha chain|nr:adenosylcobalamin-dependent ribonucleoside-diphosphate reductase [Candidatus Sulfotelmatobacter sp.]